MAKWHPIKARQAGGNNLARDFTKEGALVSLAREPVQNSTDNPLPSSTKPVSMRFRHLVTVEGALTV